MSIDAVRTMLGEYRRAQVAIDVMADEMLDRLIKTDLTKLKGYKLKTLKQRLRKFNMHTHRWAE